MMETRNYDISSRHRRNSPGSEEISSRQYGS